MSTRRSGTGGWPRMCATAAASEAQPWPAGEDPGWRSSWQRASPVPVRSVVVCVRIYAAPPHPH